MNFTFERLIGERPVGSDANNRLTDYLEERLGSFGYEISSLPFSCTLWNKGSGRLCIGDLNFEFPVSPFSPSASGRGSIIFLSSVEELRNTECEGCIAVLCPELSSEAMQPKDYPFYYPDEHKEIITLLEQKKPLAVIAATGVTPYCGLSPFPMFEDGNFGLASGYIDLETCEKIRLAARRRIIPELEIVSSVAVSQSRQLVASLNRGRKGRIIVAAHMDSKYGTLAALDNGAGLAVLLCCAEKLRGSELGIDIVPFNGEESFEASGELAYFDYMRNNDYEAALMINIDSPCRAGALNAVSLYNFDEESSLAALELVERCPAIVSGDAWYSGDHCAFLFNGTPCAALSCADLFSGGLADTHTPRDTADKLDLSLSEPSAEFIANLIEGFEKR